MYQKLILVGNVGKDPEMKYLPDGKAVATFSMATSHKYGGKDETCWWRITAWGKTAEVCSQYLSKGSKALVEGRLKADANGNPTVFKRSDGSYGSSFEVIAENVRFLSQKADIISNDQRDEIPMDDIPF